MSLDEKSAFTEELLLCRQGYEVLPWNKRKGLPPEPVSSLQTSPFTWSFWTSLCDCSSRIK